MGDAQAARIMTSTHGRRLRSLREFKAHVKKWASVGFG